MSIKRTVFIPINLKAVKKLLNYFYASSIWYGARSINPAAQEGNVLIPKQILLKANKKPRLKRDGAFLNNFGGDLLSHTVAHAVSSAQ